jgi:hypothetical protein
VKLLGVSFWKSSCLMYYVTIKIKTACMSPCRYGNDINKTIHFEKNWKNVARKLQRFCSVYFPGVKKYCRLCSVQFNTRKDKWYNDFKEWCNKNNVKTVSENVVLAYLMEKSKCEKFNFIEHIFNVEAHVEYTA